MNNDGFGAKIDLHTNTHKKQDKNSYACVDSYIENINK